MTVRALLMAVGAALPAPALAETGWSCLFTVECAAAGDCTGVEISTEIGLLDHEATLFFTEAAEAVAATTVFEGDASAVFVTHDPDAATNLITIAADGTALRSRHGPGSRAVTYFGSCEEM